MAITTQRRSVPSKTSKLSTFTAKPKRETVKRPSLELPTEPSEPEYDLNEASILFHGEEKIGKTSLVAQFPDPCFMMFEPGGKYLRIKRLPEKGQFSDWDDFVSVVDKILKTNLYQNIVFDTADLAYELASQKVVEDANEDNINEGKLGYGKGVDKADLFFKKQILRITSSGRGVIFISHTKPQEFEQATGQKYSKLIPTMKERARRFLKGFVDITAYYGYFGDERFIVIKGSDTVDAGHRIDGRFCTPSGKGIHSIPMGVSPQEGYENFVKAFNNEQTDLHIQKRKADVSEKKTKLVIKPPRR